MQPAKGRTNKGIREEGKREAMQAGTKRRRNKKENGRKKEAKEEKREATTKMQ